ncbi:MAG: PLDc N-terminal domain-containing protein [Candidatus Brocadiae bacterium]|nr:PLDc N-terminal domain-containing protein [Candidatus Brocadiia bacterium]
MDHLRLWLLVLSAAEIVLGLVASCHALMWRREPRAATLWLVIVWLMPIVGPLAYLVLGVNRSQRQARRKLQLAPTGMPACLPAERAALVGDLEPLSRLGDRVSTEPLCAGNAVEPLFNGEEAFPIMLDAIAGARRSVALCSYIFDADEIGRRFADALQAASERGVRVKLLLDAWGAPGAFSSLGRLLRSRNLRVATFAPIGFIPSRLLHLNLRNHRKILVADGTVAFSGGMNISARHLMADAARPGRCRDVHFRLRGPVVAQIVRVFAEDWKFAAGETLGGEAWFPALGRSGGMLARCVPSGPDASLERIYWFVLGAAQAARTSLHIMTPYLIPETGLRHALISAALCGVDVRIYLPAETDHRVVAWAGEAFLWELLAHGVRIIRTPGPFDHSKVAVADGRWVFFGSANLDPRSLRLNFEMNVETWDLGLARDLEKRMAALERSGRRVSLADVDSRPTLVRIRDGMAKLFTPYL